MRKDTTDVSLGFSSIIESLWLSLKSSTTRHQSLESKEKEIADFFEIIHGYLASLELKLKRPIIADKEAIEKKINIDIAELRYLVNKANVICSAEEIIDEESSAASTEPTSQFALSRIIESIGASSTLQSFVNDNRNNIFSPDINNNNNPDSTPMLDIIQKYIGILQHNTPTFNNNKNLWEDYLVTANHLDYSQLESIISKSIKVTTKNTRYILSTHSKGATLHNTSENTIEELKLSRQFSDTFQSMVPIGEYIYVFGGYANQNKWCRVSVGSKSIDLNGAMNGIEGDSSISVAYDGHDHIYLVSGAWNNRIDRFNINTKAFEKIVSFPGVSEKLMMVSTMIYRGKLYSISRGKPWMYEFDLTSFNGLNNNEPKQNQPHKTNIVAFTACHDSNGNFYIHTVDQFIKLNVETKQQTRLTPLHTNAFLVYHRASSTSSYIYSFGGEKGNFRYPIDQDQTKQPKWEQFFQDDRKDRSWCGSASVSIGNK
ncbi:hypothetical protein PPL_10893 [Heterostelium album PN500]|uniref:Uncharacterized protein n=1 Tax=Heterostelium pallidum (strain ATCC 26659 / Pp 5 / PN500) TaxID=670386 RepID=D3BSA1_HETP5|nr:hypothetical protein PPL_10893 [Heterostelium album PN500]EFA75838.1 hypothetical protein PPL_10893 [Heterostelium album PN500]|eukprot:XP_020427972.1 hypothetical protein PPL_10893 [Heterostelium album PN500]